MENNWKSYQIRNYQKLEKKILDLFFKNIIYYTLTVKENIMLPLSVLKLNKEEMNKRYRQITEALNIYDISDKYPSEISGDNVNEHLQRVHLLHILKSFLRMNQQAL